MSKKSATRKGVEPQEGNELPQAAPATKQAIDWDAVERAYRAGVLTVREIGRQHGVSHVAIGKRAKDHAWARDLTAKVREAVTTGLVTTSVTSEDKATEREIVEAAASQVITLVREHRRDIGEQRMLAQQLLAELHLTAMNRDEIEALIEEETRAAEDPNADKGAQQRAWVKRGQMLRAVALPQNASTLKDLATVLKTLVALEREAFNIHGAPEEAPKTPDDQATNAKALQSIEVLAERLRTKYAPADAKPD